jgi:hypothetical protein
MASDAEPAENKMSQPGRPGKRSGVEVRASPIRRGSIHGRPRRRRSATNVVQNQQKRESTSSQANRHAGGVPSQPIPVQVLKVFGSIVAPVTLLTALMYYFGLLHAYWFFGSFRVDYSVFELTTQDYLLRSADGLFVPLTVIAIGGLAVLWTYRLLAARLSIQQRAAAGVVVPAAAIVGLSLLTIAAIGIANPPLLHRYVTLPGLALATSVLLLLATSRIQLWRASQWAGATARATYPFAVLAAEWSAVFVLVSVGLFWAAGDYSAAVGTRRGNQVLQSLPTWPDVIVYSDKSLGLASVPGVREVRCTASGATETFRYEGLHLIVQAGGHYLLLPKGWTPDSGSALVIPKTDGLRFEFTASDSARRHNC